MLYKFKSKAAGDVIMLEPHGRRLLQIMGKEPGPRGIFLPAEMPDALAALEQAIAEDEARRLAEAQAAVTAGFIDRAEEAHKPEQVNLRQRAAPLMDMLRRSLQTDREIVWGV